MMNKLKGKIRLVVGLIEDVSDNKNIVAANESAAKRNSVFFDCLDKITPIISSYILAKRSFNFVPSEETIRQMKELLDYSKNTFEIAKAVKPEQFQKKTETLITNITSEWQRHFSSTTCELVRDMNVMLQVHSSPAAVKSCLSDIKKCEKWPLTQDMIDTYYSAETKAKKMLMEMHLDDDIKHFLTKVSEHSATLTDITPSILEWIKAENISNKIELTIRQPH